MGVLNIFHWVTLEIAVEIVVNIKKHEPSTVHAPENTKILLGFQAS